MNISLRILKYWDNIKEFNGVAISSKLRCYFGDYCFVFSHKKVVSTGYDFFILCESNGISSAL